MKVSSATLVGKAALPDRRFLLTQVALTEVSVAVSGDREGRAGGRQSEGAPIERQRQHLAPAERQR